MGTGDTMIYSGCSAGARGVMHNLNFAQARVRGWGVTMYPFMDSGLYVDLDVLNQTSSTPLRDQAAGIVRYMNPVLDPRCANAFPGDTYKCLLAEYVLGGDLVD